MYRTIKREKTCFEKYDVVEGDPIERQLEKIQNQEEEMDESAEIIFTGRDEGVLSEYNPRADMWEVAQNIQENKVKMKVLKNESSAGKEGKSDGGAESTEGNTGTLATD